MQTTAKISSDHLWSTTADEDGERDSDLDFSFDINATDALGATAACPFRIIHLDDNCICFPFGLSPTDQHHGAIEALPSSNPYQHAPNSNIAERIRDTQNTTTMDQNAVEDHRSESAQPAAVPSNTDGEVAVEENQQEQPQTQPQPPTETGEDLKKEQGQTDAPSANNAEEKESAPSPLIHHEPTIDVQTLPQDESLPATTAEVAPIVDFTQPNSDSHANGGPSSSGIDLESQAWPTAGSFFEGTNTALLDTSTLPLHDNSNTHINMQLDLPFDPLPPADFTAIHPTALGGAAADFMEYYAPPVQPAAPASGFAKLEFLDGHFYMTTYAVELGRDMRSFQVALAHMAHKQIHEENMAKPLHKRSSSVPGTPARQINIDSGASVARSFVSESGGIVGDDDGHISLGKKRRKKGQKAQSTETSSSRSHLSRKNSTTHLENQYAFANQAQQFATVDPHVTASIDPMVQLPDPHYMPLIPIHPPKSEAQPHPLGKGISRKHVRIAYNFDKGHFEMSVYGRNGAFHDDDHYGMGNTVALHDGSRIQIGGVSMTFVLPNVAMSDEEVDEDLGSVSGRMSFGFEDTRGESIVADDDESVMEGPRSDEDDPYANTYYDETNWDIDDDDEEEEEDEDDDDEANYESPQASRQKLKIKAPSTKVEKHVGKHSSVSKSAKSVTKLTLKLSSKEKARAEAEAKERERERAREERREERRALKVKQAAKQAKREAREAKEAAKEAKAQQAKEAANATKQPAKAPSKAPSKQPSKKPSKDIQDVNEIGDVAAAEAALPSKDPSKTPIAEENKPPKEPPAPRISRDAPMQNGDEVTVVGLPAGVIIPARKKGPGRPPKDGVMSKRERALLIKQAKERDKAIKLGLDPSQIPPPEMKPPKPRPRKNSQGEDIDGDDCDGDDKKSTRIPRPPRSPSPEMKVEDYTEEQLQRPQPNYVYLIYEAIQNCATGVMNLQQIYSAIERRYPYFKFRTTSNGWQSSVRHNLGQHEVC